ncbi:MAG TPA: hypothetical protein VEH31_03040 [Streptosporangiaceae bacterium]|nr:hypothetical protein [Streptosporangiaceae bacterium]
MTWRDGWGRRGPGSVAWRNSQAEAPQAVPAAAWSAAGRVVVGYGPHALRPHRPDGE